MTCDPSNTYAVSLNLNNRGLSGSLPDNCFSVLTNLTSLIVSSASNLNGPVPSSLQYLTSLVTLNIYFTSLNGTFPNYLAGMTNLQSVNLRGNQFTGAIADQFANLTQLQSFIVGNQPSLGPFPPSLGLLSSLTNLQAYSAFNGNFPDASNWTQMQTLDLSGNFFVGSMSSGWGNMRNLVTISVANNRGITGPLPSSIGNWINVQQVNLANCIFSGS